MKRGASWVGRLVVSSVVTLLVGGTASLALAQAPPGTVTLAASAGRVTYGEPVTLSGSIAPATEGETVELVDIDTSEMLGEAVTDAQGAFSFRFEPDRNLLIAARWATAESEQVVVEVRPVLSATIGAVFLFGDAIVKGRVRPALGGERLDARLLRRNKTVERKTTTVRSDGTFRVLLPVDRPGRFRAEVSMAPADHLPASDRTGSRKTPLPGLRQGSNGKVVKFLERRLDELDYRIVAINRGFDYRTGDAVLAFHKVQGMPRTKSVDRATWHRLARPRIPRPRATSPAFHVEIDQTKQVLYVIRGGEIDEIVHTSTGAGGATRDGVFSVHRKIAGYSPNRLYYPSYFDGNRAVHGWPEVPTYPASHGCSRVPYWTAIWLHGLMDYGTQVRVYH